MPKKAQGRWLFGMIVVLLLATIGRNLYHYYQERALMAAVDEHDETTALALLDKGMYRDQPRKLESLLEEALKHNAPRVACALLNRGVDPNGNNTDSPPLFRAVSDCPAAVKCLLDRGADPNITIGMSGNALNIACFRDDIATFRLLLARGTRPDSANLESSPLRAAVINNRLSFARALLDAGLNRTTQSDALRVAVDYERVDFMKLLLERGARPDLGSYDWQTTLAQVKQRHSASVLALLQKAGPQITPAHTDAHVRLTMPYRK